MDWYKFIKENYIIGNYNSDNVRIFVIKNKITSEQYKQITGIDFDVIEGG